MNWNLKLIGIEPTPENVVEMKYLSENIGTMSREDFGRRQAALFEKPCEALLTRKAL